MPSGPPRNTTAARNAVIGQSETYRQARVGPSFANRLLQCQQPDPRWSATLVIVATRGPNRAALVQEVLASSQAPTWERAVMEWQIVACEEDLSQESACVCGHQQLRYLFTIENGRNGNALFPIGSVCIKQFGRQDLDDEAAIREKLFQLLHAVENGRFISLKSGLFSRKLLLFLFEQGAFQPNVYNGFDGENDYEFMLEMFNKHNDPTERQQGKINAVIFWSVLPYLRTLLRPPRR